MKKFPFRRAVAETLPVTERLKALLTTMQPHEWLPVAELFAAALPESDAVVGMPGAEALATQVGKMRGVPDLSGQPVVSPEGFLGAELLLLTPHLQDGEPEAQMLNQLRQAGWQVIGVAAAVERTNLGGRQYLGELGVRVQAIVQLADTPDGLVPERRTPDRWTTPVRSF